MPWYREHGGAVLSTTIDKYCYISLRKLPPFFEYKHRICYSKIECVKELSEIIHPSVRETLKWFKVSDGLEIHHDGDLPARSGLGSSSSFTVGLVKALRALQGRIINSEELSRIAIDIEQNMIGESCGSQDQVAAAYGGFNKINFNPDLSISVKPLIIPHRTLTELQKGLALFYSGTSRFADEIEKDKIRQLSKLDRSMSLIREAVDESERVLSAYSFSLSDFGKLLAEMWGMKKTLSEKVSTSFLEDIYAKAMKSGAYGGKVLGAGGGGFCLFCVEPWLKEKLIRDLHPLIHVPFKFEPEGSRIALYAPNGTI